MKHIFKKKISFFGIFFGLVLIVSSILYKRDFLNFPTPESNHLIGDGVYFNVFTKETKDKETTGIFSNVDCETIFYASIQNSGKDRHMKLKAYLNYISCPLEFLDSSYNIDDIYLANGDNIIIPFQIKGEILPDVNYKFLISLFIGTDQHEMETHYQTTAHTLSYDYFINNKSSSMVVDLLFNRDTTTQYSDSNFPGFVINEDFSNTPSVQLPPYVLEVDAGETFQLAYKLGHISSDSTLLLLSINYDQVLLNDESYSLLVDTPEGYLASGTVSITAPSESGVFEICAVAIPSPVSSNPFELLENAYRFSLVVK